MSLLSKLKSLVTKSAIMLQIPQREKPFVMNQDHQMFPELKEAVQSKDLEKVEAIVNKAEKVSEYVHGAVSVKNGLVSFNGEPVHGTLVKRILDSMNDGLPSKPLILFLENLMQNPSKNSRSELYDFMQAAKIPVTSDGRFVAYKWVDSNYMDVHSRTNKHEISKVISMPRERVVDNKHQTCAAGLHVCGANYDKFGSKLLLVLVNPKDVVSVPVDYKNHKMRVCAYQVFKEIKDTERYGVDDIIEASPQYHTKMREPAPVIAPKAVPELPVPVVTKEIEPVVAKEKAPVVAKPKVTKKKPVVKAKPTVKSKTVVKKPAVVKKATVKAPVVVKQVISDADFKQFVQQIKYKKGRNFLKAKFNLTDDKYDVLLTRAKAEIKKGN